MSKENENKRKKIEKFWARHKTGIFILTTFLFFGLYIRSDQKSITYSNKIVQLKDSITQIKYENDSLKRYSKNLKTQIIANKKTIKTLNQTIKVIQKENKDCLDRNTMLRNDLNKLGNQISNLYSLYIQLLPKAQKN